MELPNPHRNRAQREIYLGNGERDGGSPLSVLDISQIMIDEANKNQSSSRKNVGISRNINEAGFSLKNSSNRRRLEHGTVDYSRQIRNSGS